MNIAVAQSGGPTVAINASLMGVFEQALKSVEIDKVYGSLNGIEGIINQNLVVLNDLVKGEEDIELIKTTPSTVLGSCRYKMPSPDDKPEVYEKIVECFKKHNIGAFFYIGGNDSMDTTDKLSKYTMQNGIDLISQSCHGYPGFRRKYHQKITGNFIFITQKIIYDNRNKKTPQCHLRNKRYQINSLFKQMIGTVTEKRKHFFIHSHGADHHCKGTVGNILFPQR